MYADMDNFITMNNKQAYDANNKNEATYKSSFVITIVLILVGLFLATALGLSIAFLISNQLKKVLVFASALGDGDLSATTEEINSMMEATNQSTEQIAEGAQELSTVVEEVTSSMQIINDTTNKLSNC